jgi:3-methyladenine DNA glycosylase AlkD
MIEIVSSLKNSFEKNANPLSASKMSAYMKNKFCYYGIKAPLRNELIKEWLLETKNSNVNFWGLIHHLWNLDQREYQYVAIELLKKKKADFFSFSDIHEIEGLITSKSWWDTVDLIAADTLGKYLIKFPDQKIKIISDFSERDNLWLNRSTLIFQLKYKDKLDFELLKSLVIHHYPNKDFFIQKAIGWSLRQYAKTAPNEVLNFVIQTNLDGLAKREALKKLT